MFFPRFIRADKESAFEMLIQSGADPSLKDNKEFTVLHSAAEGGKASIINELFLPGLNVDSRDNDGVTVSGSHQ